MTDLTPAAPPALELRSVVMRYPRTDQPDDFLALDDINLEVPRSSFTCLIGPSGCGKSTLLNLAAGFEHPTRGEVRVAGQPVTGPDPRRIFVFQEAAIFPWMPVAENVAFGLPNLPVAERTRRVTDALAMVGLAESGPLYPRQLSGGMRQRAEIARALVVEPDVLFMDEPFSALDYFTKLRLRRDLLALWSRTQMTILFVTHDVEEAVQLADRIVVMDRWPGRIKSLHPIDLPRPRDIDAPEYLALRDHLLRELSLA